VEVREKMGFVGSGFLGEVLEERAVEEGGGGSKGIVVGVFDVVEIENEFARVLLEERGIGGGPEVVDPYKVVVLVGEDLMEGSFVAGEAIDQGRDSAEGAIEVAEDFGDG